MQATTNPQKKPYTLRRLVWIGVAAVITFCCCIGFAATVSRNQVPAPTADTNAVQTYIVETTNALAVLNSPTTAPTTEGISTFTAEATGTPVPTETLLATIVPQTDVCVFCNMECPRNQLDNHFCIADPKLVGDQALFEKTLRAFCDQQAGDYCQVLVWTDANYLPTSLPMSEESLYYEVADYSRNKTTGYDCFTLLSQGNIVHQSGDC